MMLKFVMVVAVAGLLTGCQTTTSGAGIDYPVWDRPKANGP
jgi:predicted small secreted protein